MSPRRIQKLLVGILLSAMIIAAVFYVSVLDSSSAALPLYLGIAAVGALFVRMVMAPR